MNEGSFFWQNFDGNSYHNIQYASLGNIKTSVTIWKIQSGGESGANL